MMIYLPYTSEGLARTAMEDVAESLGIRVEIEYLGIKRIRRTDPNVKGIPHKTFKVRLFPIGDEYRAWSTRPWDLSHARRKNAVCWHAYKNFFTGLLVEWNPNATIRTGYIKKGGIEYNGLESFLENYRATKSVYYDSGYASCRCSGDKLATWERASDHYVRKDFVRGS